MTKRYIVLLGCVALAVAVGFAADTATDERTKAFEKLLAKAQREWARLPEDEAIDLLKMGQELRRPQAVGLAIKTYLSTRAIVDPDLMRLSAENARITGDFRMAVARYKQYLKTASDSKKSSDLAADLYTIMVEYMGSGADAFNFMDESGGRFREGVQARKFDEWFMNMARNQRSYEALAKRLAIVMGAPQLPLLQEKSLCWGHMDWLMSEITIGRPEHIAALPSVKQIIPLIREDPARTARFRFYAAKLGYKASLAGKDATSQERDYVIVTDEAKNYVDAVPTAATVQDIVTVFAGGYANWNPTWDEGDWNRGMAAKRELFKHAFAKIPDSERKALLAWNWNNWQNRLGSDMWADLGAAMPETFKSAAGTAQIQFNMMTTPEQYRKMAPFLQGVQSKNAAVINSMAVSADDLWACAQNLIQKESWYLNATDIHGLFYQQMCPAFNGYARDDAHKLPARFIEGVQQRFGTEIVFRSPLALLHPDSAREHMLMVWRNNGRDPNDKSQVPTQLHALDWVPYTEEQRRNVYTFAYDEFKRWAEEVRKSFDNRGRAQQEAARLLENAKKKAAETAKYVQDTRKSLETTSKAKIDTAAGIEAAKQLIATTTTNLKAAEAELKAAKDAKDAAKTADAQKKTADLGKALADLGAKQRQLEASLKEQDLQIANLQKASGDLKVKAQQDELLVLDLSKKIDSSANPENSAEAQGKLITELEKAFKEVMDPKIADPSKAPDPLCQNLARMVQAIQTKNLDGYLTAARAVYPTVKDYATKKTPYGQHVFSFLVQNRPEFDTIDFQCEVLADQLAALDPNVGSQSLSTAMNLMVTGRPGWNFWTIPAGDKNRALKLNNVLAKALLAIVEKNRFSPEVFEWFRATRRGNGWHEAEANVNVMTKIIEKNSLQYAPTWRPWGSSAMPNYCYLIRNDFPTLAKQYPTESYFDDMYVAEVSKTRTVDQAFWNYSQDQQRKGANIAAQIFQDYAKLPFWGEGRGPSGDFWQLQERALNADPGVRDAMLKKIESYYGQTRWDSYANGAIALRYIDISKSEGRKEFFDKLGVVCDRVASLPWHESAPYVPQLSGIQRAADLTLPELNSLVKMFPAYDSVNPWPNWMGRIALLVHEGLMGQKRVNELFDLAPTLWRALGNSNDAEAQRKMAQYTSSLMDTGEYDLGGAYSVIALSFLGGGCPEDIRNALMAVKARAQGKSGGVIPVDRTDRRYPIFAAQADYQAGKYDNAWEQYLANKALLSSEFKELDPAFSIWLLEKHTEAGNYSDAEGLAQTLIQWVEATPQGFDPEMRAHLLVSYADISYTKQEYPRARAQYERIVMATDLDGTLYKKKAELKIAAVDRVTKNFDRAMELLDKLVRRKDKYLQAEAGYQIALIKRDQQDYDGALEALNGVFAVDMNHADARILEGRVRLEKKKYEDATQVRVGEEEAQGIVIPGKVLRVQLKDRSLAVVGKATEVEVRIWADSGDEEFLRLLPFGDTKDQFQGQIQTAMGPIVKGDRQLQILGSDRIHYDYSDKFKKKNNIAD